MLRPTPLPPVPAETARIARAAFPKGHPLSWPFAPSGLIFWQSLRESARMLQRTE